jgi:PAS domain S-box-containing protein
MPSPRADVHGVEDEEATSPTVASVLMVDDHPPNLLALEAVLSPLGHRLVPVTSGRQALTELLAGDFAVILLDVQMAGMDGFETASLIKSHKRTASIPLIFITAFSRDAENIFTGYARGGVDYLLKPVDPDILRSKVSVFIELYLRGQTIRAQQAVIRLQELARAHAKHGRRFRNVLESMPLPVWCARVDGSLEFASRAWRDYSGRTPEPGSPVVDPASVHPEDLSLLERQWALTIRRQSPFAVECRLRRHDGAYRWHVCRAVAEYGESGQVEGWIVTATDIDDHKRQDAERSRLLLLERKARSDAEMANAAKDAFLATVSHELRTPLNAILGWAGLLSSGKVPRERVPSALETIQRNALAQARLVDDLLDLSRVVFGKLQLSLEWTPLEAIVRAAVEAIRPAAAAKQVTILYAADCDDVILADAPRLQQVVGNLLVNAVKFNDAGGRVELTIARVPHGLEIAVTDTGKGLSAESLRRVFDRFHQVDPAEPGRVEGLGLGLAVVEQLVLLHGGKVTAESPGVGAGSTFRVFLPSHASGAAVDVPAARPSGRSLDEAPTLDGHTVLIVDDEADARSLLTEVLQNRGATVVPMSSALAALEFLAKATPAALISDISMPELDGYSLIRAIRKREAGSGARLPAIALTAHAYQDDSRHAVSEGFDLHLSKPFDAAGLVEALVAVMKRGAVVTAAAESARRSASRSSEAGSPSER